MPIYEYRCSACGNEVEALRKLSDPPLTTCPACHAEALVKRVSAAGFQLKGSGWYVTDFRSSGKPAAKKDGGDSTPDSKADAKTDAKPDTAADTKSEKKTEAKSEASTSSSGNGTTTTSS